MRTPIWPLVRIPTLAFVVAFLATVTYRAHALAQAVDTAVAVTGEPPPPVAGAAWLPLGDGKWTLVDPDIAERFRSVKLHHNVGYAYFSIRRGKWDYASGPLHREIMGVADVPVSEIEVDHANGNRADNRRANLRLCSRAENSRNAPGWAVSGFKGVSKSKRRWYASIRVDGVKHRLGGFDDPVSAAKAYDEAAKRLHGAFAKLNFPKE